MKPVDFRNENWEQIEGRLTGMRETVWCALTLHGPCTTLELAARAKLNPFSVRPRVCELCQLGFARLAAAQPDPAEGVYEAVDVFVARGEFLAAKEIAVNGPRQLDLRLTA
jgi:hypothetical protein